MKTRVILMAAVAIVFASSPLCARERATLDPAWAEKLERAKRDYAVYSARAWSRFLVSARPAAARLYPAPSAVAGDATLRAGDIVMTERGMMVFSGSQVGTGRQSGFERLADWRGDDRLRADLIAIEKASLRADGADGAR